MPIEYTYKNYVDRIHEAVNMKYPHLKMSKDKVSKILNVMNHVIIQRIERGIGVYLFFCSIIPYCYDIRKRKRKTVTDSQDEGSPPTWI